MTKRPRGSRAVIYTRLSLDRSEDGLAVERQSKEAHALARDHGWEVVGEYSDNSFSASSGIRRPGWEQILTSLKDGTADVLVGYAPDRFLRRPKDLEALLDIVESREVRVATVTAGDYDLNTAGGRGMARMMVTFASMETEQKSERQQAQERQRAEQGRPRFVQRPFGYLDDGLTPHPVEGPALAAAIRNVIAGGTLGGVIREWTQAGLKPPRGGKWQYSSFNALLKRPRNAGLSVYRGEVVANGTWEPLVSVPEHEAVLAVLANPARRTSRAGRRWLLPGIATCGVCGSAVKAGGVTARGEKRSIYLCRDAAHIFRSAVPIDAMVEEVLRTRLMSKDTLRLMTPRFDTAPTISEVAALRARLASAEQDYADGLINGRQLQEATARIEASIGKHQTSISDAEGASAVLPDVSQGWDSLSLERKRLLIRAMLDIRIHRKGSEPQGCGPYGCHIQWLNE